MNEAPERNRKMFYQIADIIECAPEKHDQKLYVTLKNGEDFVTDIIGGHEVTCGTTQCIAGWAIQLEGDMVFAADIALTYDGCAPDYSVDPDEEAAEILGLTEDEASTLFHTYNNDLDWPQILRSIGDGANVQETIDDARDAWQYG